MLGSYASQHGRAERRDQQREAEQHDARLRTRFARICSCRRHDRLTADGRAIALVLDAVELALAEAAEAPRRCSSARSG